jgi:hypothetical protein
VVSVLLIVFWWCLYWSPFSGGVCIGHRFLVVSVLVIVFWWCLYCSSFSGGVYIGHRFLVVSVLITVAIQTPPENDEQYRHHQKTMSNTDTTRKRSAI